MILSSLIDYAVLLIPPVIPPNLNPEQLQLLNLQQPVNVTTQLIDRGIIPMVGLALLFGGFWIDSNSGATNRKGLSALLQPASLALALILGIAFLGLTAVNVNSQRLLNQEQMKRIGQQVQAAETQLSQLKTQIANNPSQIEQTLSQINQVIDSGQFQGQQLNPQQLEELKQRREQLQQLKDPKAVEQLTEKRQTEVRSRRLQAEQQAKQDFFKSAFRSGVSSLLLGLGYLGIAWMGVSGLVGGVKPPRR